MAIFTLKSRDTRPILEVALKNPDGTAHDLTGSTAWKLHIRVNGSSVITRDMVKQGLDTAGILRYTWVAADWDAGALPNSEAMLKMEYEVIGGSSRMTFPNNGHDTLKIVSDLA
jgi:hypothetical protein